MEDADVKYDLSTSCEGSEDLNGKDAVTRLAPCISAPRLIMKRRVGGALVPMRQPE